MPKKRPPKYAKSLEEVGVLLGRTKATIVSWGQLSGCPCRREHKHVDLGYDLDRIRRWAQATGLGVDAKTGRITGDRRGGNRNSDSEGYSEDVTDGKPSVALVFKTAQADEKRAKAALVQLELEQRSGAVHSIEDCQDHDRKRHRFMRRTLLALPRLAPTLAGKPPLEIQSILEKKVEEIMRAFSGEAAQ